MTPDGVLLVHELTDQPHPRCPKLCRCLEFRRYDVVDPPIVAYKTADSVHTTPSAVAHARAAKLEMIGMVNVPCDSPIDFYAAPRPHELPKKCNDIGEAPRTPLKRTPSYRPLFMSTRKKIVYAQDGRKYSDGVALEKSEPNKLWEELILRTFAHRFEEEIQSPVDSYKTLESELEKLDVKDKSLYRSTYSLVSPNRVEGTDVVLEEHTSPHRQKRSLSTDQPLLPFIKSIKGKKKVNKAK